MSVLPKDLVKVIAESSGIANLPDDLAAALAADVEYRAREIVQEAVKFRNHAKRKVLMPDDVNMALRLLNIESMYGFSAPTAAAYRSVPGQPDLWYLEDREIDLADIINRNLPKCPLDISVAAHWLAVEGVQPAIPQNPPPAMDVQPTVIKKRRPPTEESSAQQPPHIRPRVEHHISRELQFYFEKVTAAVKGTDETLKATAYDSLATDPGITQLVPYLTQFIADEVTRNLRNLPLLQSVMCMARSLLISQHLHVEPYVHQLMPSILTCLLGKRLCASAMDDHWQLRDYAANLVGVVCKKFGRAYSDLQPRITKTLSRAFLDPAKPLTTHYGAIVGITALGHHCSRLLILPHVKAYYSILQKQLDSPKPARRAEAGRVDGALWRAVSDVLRALTAPGKSLADVVGELPVSLDDLHELFGDRVDTMARDSDEVAMQL
eukprot:TRINITY_DN13910_c0_g1_i1.p1 TRINITY_DN13910_c0_g1~~TRINITY_DN13910_c0_g1_i1.p1  ORF type:complete len:436 (+),score=98.10 TRINITY_DN13910_c0_g1_i1:47-1354(+)